PVDLQLRKSFAKLPALGVGIGEQEARHLVVRSQFQNAEAVALGVVPSAQGHHAGPPAMHNGLEEPRQPVRRRLLDPGCSQPLGIVVSLADEIAEHKRFKNIAPVGMAGLKKLLQSSFDAVEVADIGLKQLLFELDSLGVASGLFTAVQELAGFGAVAGQTMR